MPYIAREKRRALQADPGSFPKTPGELNFVISDLISVYLGDDYHYADINEVIGVLECAKLELYRRIAAPYEDTKLEANGDVY